MANGKRKLKLPDNKLLSILKGMAMYALIAFAALIFFYNISGGSDINKNEVPISQIINDIKQLLLY